jgi:hypothetical protein
MRKPISILASLIVAASTLAASAAQADPAPAHNPLKYYGGRVISNVEVVQVLWGTGQQSDVATQLGPFYQAVTGSYLDDLAEYDTVGRMGVGPTAHAGSNQHIDRGTFKSTVAITPLNNATTLSDADVANELVAQINANKLPKPSVDAAGNYDTIYMIDLPSTVVMKDAQLGSSCNDAAPVGSVFCAYDGATAYMGKNLSYGVFPDITAAGCNVAACGVEPVAFDNVTALHSHRLANAVTDPDLDIFTHDLAAMAVDFPVGWYADATGAGSIGGDIGDICEGTTGSYTATGKLPGTTYTVAKLWSQAAQACVIAPALPKCSGANRPCTPCASDADCAAGADGGASSTPHCQTAAGNPKAGQCVACATNAHCSGDAPICDTTSSTCRACGSNADCTGNKAGAVCATSSGDARKGSCVQCEQTTDCPALQICDTTSDTCGVAPPDAGATTDGAASPEGGTGPGDGSTTTTTSCAASPSSKGSAAFAGALGALLALAAARRKRG